MKHKNSPMETHFSQIVDILKEQQFILKEVIKWKPNPQQKEEIFGQLIEIGKMLPVLVSGCASFKKEETNLKMAVKENCQDLFQKKHQKRIRR